MGSLLQNTVFGRKKHDPFLSTWKTDNISAGSSASNQVKLPLISTGIYNFYVEWGDGTSNLITGYNQAQVTHNYSTIGTYEIKIRGICTGWVFANTGDRAKILSISSWGNLKLGTNQGNYFQGCINLNLSTVSDLLDLTGTSTMNQAFRGCSNLSGIGRVNEWITTSVTNMGAVFRETIFNQNIGAWNVSNVTDFSLMFNTSSFNQPIGSWVIASAINLSSMFSSCPFNQPIGNWNTGNVTTINSMFSFNTAFNQNIGAWNVSKVVDMNTTFRSAVAFNNGGSSDINNWNTILVTNMSSMFHGASNFNQPIGNWNTGNVTTFTSMFRSLGSGCKFNQNIGAWNVSKATNFTNMFYKEQGVQLFNNGGSSDINNWVLNTSAFINMEAMFVGATNFNQPIGNWNTINVTRTVDMFNGANIFNQNIGSWNTANITSMLSMFQGASAFNQNIGAWNVSNVTNFTNMFSNAYTFNQNIGSWDVSKVTNFSNMFINALAFNNGGSPDINNWVTSSAVNMALMFQGASAFNQPIGNWNVSNVTNFVDFMRLKTAANYSSANLDSLYNGWSSRPVLANHVINFGTIKYTAAGAAGKGILTGSTNNWTIVDGGI